MATGFVTVAATGKLDAPSVLLVSAALALRGLAFLGFSCFSLAPSTVTRLTVAYFFFYAFDYLFLSRAFVEATGHLVFFVMVMKLFSARVNRDFLYLAVLAFLEMLLAAILTIDTTFLAFFLAFMTFGIATFASYEIRSSYQRAVHPAEVPGTPMLRSLGATSVLASISVLLLGGLIFFVLPRYTTGYLSRFAPRTQHIAGFSDDVTLGEIGDIKKTRMVVMRVRFKWLPPQLQQLRWRGVALTQFDGKRWYNANVGSTVLSAVPAPGSTARMTRGGPFLPPSRAANQPPGPGAGLHGVSGAHLVRQPVPDPGSPAGDRALPLAGGGCQRCGAVAQAELRRPSLRRRLHAGSARPEAAAGRAHRVSGADRAPTRATITCNCPPWIPGWQSWPNGSPPPPAIPTTAHCCSEEHLRTQYGYTLEMPFTGDDPIAGFLFEQRRGHCEYFASAMTVMPAYSGHSDPHGERLPARRIQRHLGTLRGTDERRA